MKKIFKKNQIILTLLAVMIVVAGYLNYAGKTDKEALTSAGVNQDADGMLLDISESDIMNENQSFAEMGAVDETEAQTEPAEDVNAPAEDSSGEIVDVFTVEEEPEQPDIDQTPGEAVLTNGMTVVDYVAGVQLDREQTRAKNKETLSELINNGALTEDQRQAAVNSMLRLTEIAEKETTTESLLGAKGFENSIVCISDDYVDVIIGRKEVSDAERAQIEDIVKRETGYALSDIVITMLEIEE